MPTDAAALALEIDLVQRRLKDIEKSTSTPPSTRTSSRRRRRTVSPPPAPPTVSTPSTTPVTELSAESIAAEITLIEQILGSESAAPITALSDGGVIQAEIDELQSAIERQNAEIVALNIKRAKSKKRKT